MLDIWGGSVEFVLGLIVEAISVEIRLVEEDVCMLASMLDTFSGIVTPYLFFSRIFRACFWCTGCQQAKLARGAKEPEIVHNAEPRSAGFNFHLVLLPARFLILVAALFLSASDARIVVYPAVRAFATNRAWPDSKVLHRFPLNTRA